MARDLSPVLVFINSTPYAETQVFPHLHRTRPLVSDLEALLRCNMSLRVTPTVKSGRANTAAGQKACAPSAPATHGAASSALLYYPGDKRRFISVP
ncbi:hypothetical protein [Novosphingobium sp. 32-60-15]|uniref:hypothetical protein n=1 Tax=Novosphingobium sp. 32-60-15 TaxID=1970410 RepID=UPI0025D5CDC6|nr:hypothetical protein [Novosphingobium sp. 32-60-15]